MRWALRLQERHDQYLRKLLLSGNEERAAYVLCRRAVSTRNAFETERATVLVSVEIVQIPDSEIVSSSSAHIAWNTDNFVRLVCRAERDDLILCIAHSHPPDYFKFSSQDDTNERELFRYAFERSDRPETVVGSILYCPEGQIKARVWEKALKDPIACGKISVVGDRLRVYDDSETRPFLARQVLALGAEFVKVLRGLRVAVVGCGGTGSPTATMLARLGVGELVLIDDDLVDATNLNRMFGARQADADAGARKVDTLARSITELGLGCKVRTHFGLIFSAELRDTLKSCDVIFGCTDDHQGRMFLNRFAYFYSVLVIDVGLHIAPGGQALKHIDARVSLLRPGVPCLLCRDEVSAERARADSVRRSNPAEYSRLKAEAYIDGEGNPSPSVITFTTEAATMGVNALLQAIAAFRGEKSTHASIIRLIHFGSEELYPKLLSRDGCKICSTDRVWGRADVEPFLDMVT